MCTTHSVPSCTSLIKNGNTKVFVCFLNIGCHLVLKCLPFNSKGAKQTDKTSFAYYLMDHQILKKNSVHSAGVKRYDENSDNCTCAC